MNRLFVALVAGVGLMLAGCGDDKAATVSDANKGALEELGRMLKDLADEGRKPPSKLAELEPVEPMIPTAGPPLRNGEIVYLWGAAYAAGGEKVVAHEKKTPTEGGLVLLQDGSVKSMSAQEFAAAPKAK